MSGNLTERVRLEGADAIGAFNARYGEMERVLWCLSKHCREPLVAARSAPVVEALIWTLKSWWGVQGVRTKSRAIIADVLTGFGWTVEMFDDGRTSAPPVSDATDFACEIVGALVERSKQLGVPRREFSLASKVLHWLMPWRVPVYDSFVREVVRVPAAWDHPEAYRRVARRAFEVVSPITAADPGWVGEIEPASPLRAFDKCLWWFGGGNAATAVETKNPWRVIDQLGLDRL